jgi:hypothetical protein
VICLENGGTGQTIFVRPLPVSSAQYSMIFSTVAHQPNLIVARLKLEAALRYLGVTIRVQDGRLLIEGGFGIIQTRPRFRLWKSATASRTLNYLDGEF